MEIIEPEEVGVEGLEDGEEMWTGSSEEEDTMEEELYECKVEVKTRETTIPTSVRTIESVGDVPGWAPITPYLNVSKSLPTSAAEEVAGITGRVVAGVVTSPESVMSCTDMITTPDSSISLQSQLSMAEVSLINQLPVSVSTFIISGSRAFLLARLSCQHYPVHPGASCPVHSLAYQVSCSSITSPATKRLQGSDEGVFQDSPT